MIPRTPITHTYPIIHTYTISDGRSFLDENTARNHQLMLDIQRWIVENPIDPELAPPPPGRFTRWLFKHRKLIREILCEIEKTNGTYKPAEDKDYDTL